MTGNLLARPLSLGNAFNDSKWLHPFQCITVSQSAFDGHGLLVAASGPLLLSIDLRSGKSVAAWHADTSREKSPDRDEERPEKRRKLERPAPSEDAIEGSPEPKTLRRMNIIKIAISKSEKHIVAVTGEDKCVHVFKLAESGQLRLLSQRYMPKRPSTLSVTPDGNMILCGDKFGDVYSLPLLLLRTDDTSGGASETQPEEVARNRFVPAATNLTVHTVRNRKALEAQLRASEQKPAKPKGPLKFSHQLLLGHVSMLTDMLVAFVPVTPTKQMGAGSASCHTYLLTADRDEHIRISRGPPQSHIIEGYCLAHKEFVSKMCLVDANVLVSGGGDDHLFIWDWLHCKLLKKINIRPAVERFLDSLPTKSEVSSKGNNCNKQPGTSSSHDADSAGESQERLSNLPVKETSKPDLESRELHLSVSGIWPVPRLSGVFVACEGIPALLYVTVEVETSKLRHEQQDIVPLGGNVLDLALHTTGESTSVIVSIDNVHQPGSITAVRNERELKNACRLEMLTYSSEDGAFSWTRNDDMKEVQATVESSLRDEGADGLSVKRREEEDLRALLYQVGSLRKRGAAEESTWSG